MRNPTCIANCHSSKFSADIIAALRDEMRDLVSDSTIHTAVLSSRPNNPYLQDKKLRSKPKIKQRNVDISSDSSSDSESSSNKAPDDPPRRIHIQGNTYTLDDPSPERTLAHILARAQFPHNANLLQAAATGTTLHAREAILVPSSSAFHRASMELLIIFWLAISLIILYIITLCCIASSRAIRQPDTKQTLVRWKERRHVERELMALEKRKAALKRGLLEMDGEK